MDKKVKIALLQHTCSEDIGENRKKVIAMIREAAGKGANMICTQELAFSTYFCQTVDEKYFDLAKPIPCDDTEEMSALAKELGVVIIYSMFERSMPGIYYNASVVFDNDGTYLGKYRKNHIPEDPLFLEKFYFTQSDLGFPVFDTAYGRIGVLICWDQWFPEAARLIALQGARIIFYPTAIGFIEDSVPEEPVMWQDAVRAHGIHNGLFIAACNRVGKEYSKDGYIDFYGRTFVSDPYGVIIAEEKTQKDEIVYADLDLSDVDEIRKSFPFFRDRRIDKYEALLKREL